MEIFTCELEITNNKRTIARQILQTPRMILEHQFISAVNRAANCSTPVSVKLSRKESIYNQFDNEWKELENSITFKNNAYIKEYGEE